MMPQQSLAMPPLLLLLPSSITIADDEPLHNDMYRVAQ